MDKTQWLENRKKGLGASEVSAILGLSPYKSNIQLWREKTGKAVAKDISMQPFVQYGIDAEEPIRRLFELDYPQYQVDYKDYDVYRNSKYDWLLATLDGVLTDKTTGKKGILEIKTTNILNKQMREKWNDKVPQNYYIQILHQFLATGFDFAILKANLKTNFNEDITVQTKHYFFKREELQGDLDYLLQKEIKFWECVTENKQPNLVLPPIQRGT